jgi:hypothetical protein
MSTSLKYVGGHARHVSGTPLDQAAVRERFDRGVAWALKHADGLSADARVAVLAGLLLADRERAAAAATVLRPRPGEGRRAAGRLLDIVTLGMTARLRRRRNRAAPLFSLIERDPGAVAGVRFDDHEYIPQPVSQPIEALHIIDGAHVNAALVQASLGHLEEPVLSWLRRDDLCGYNLSHQLLAWVLCLKVGHRIDEASGLACAAGWRLFNEIERGPSRVHRDLAIERLVFLGLSGFPLTRLSAPYTELLESQDPRDGGWWFTAVPSEQDAMLERVHLGASPLIKTKRPYRAEAEPEAARRRLEVLHRGHTTGLGVWALGLWLTADSSPWSAAS